MTNKLYLIALSAVLVGSSCSKKSEDAPAPLPTPVVAGPAITGLVQPADAVRGVTLTDNITHQTISTAAVDGQTGAYYFDALPTGTYELFYIKNTNYIPPRQQTVTVVAGKTTVVPPLTAARSTATLVSNGAQLPLGFIDLSIAFDGLNPLRPSCFAIMLSDKQAAAAYCLYMVMPYAVTVGTYSLNATQTYAVFTENKSGVYDSRLNPPTVPLGGTLIITAVENIAPFPRSVSGTYSFTATSPTTGASKIISGAFTNAYF
ncbi:hypothetical protein [Hymenobacter convexus]|uniref:hypothetical protein n=1 Tax=Hymenobacter sp. CA1UV-4 TaxID=3063782 RepID=UPI0027129B63|nr:hypothetical protein [Hymenobacter sp. CA1UV-4]MDO7851328.1 hypothetical protein [Hymenobacter sp. CA1UV-4]